MKTRISKNISTELAENEISSVNIFKKLYSDNLFVIFNYLKGTDIRTFASINKFSYDYIFNNYNLLNKTGYKQCYFTLSQAIPLFDTFYSNIHNIRRQVVGSYCSSLEEHKPTLGEMEKLPDQILLFSQYASIEKYCSYVSKLKYDNWNDVFNLQATPAILLVSLSFKAKYYMQPIRFKFSKQFPDCPAPPYESAIFQGIKTPRNNIAKIHAAEFNNQFFNPRNAGNTQFEKIWNKTYNTGGKSIQARVLAAAKSLFESYSSWPHHRWTRHNHLQVNSILFYINRNPSLIDLYKLINNYNCQPHKVNPKGHYKKMLSFVLSELRIYYDSRSLNGIDDFFKTNHRNQR